MVMKLILTCAASIMQIACADVYYNNKTFSQSETVNEIVHIGHADATDGGDPANALVTVKSGAVWTNTQSVFLGATANGYSRLTVKGGASVDLATLTIAMGAGNESGIHGVFELQENAKAVITNITVVYNKKKLVGNTGVVRIAQGASISGICSFNAGSTNCITRIEIDGGEMEFDSSENAAGVSMYIGSDYRGGYAGGVLSGWGKVGFSNANLIMNVPQRVGREDHQCGEFRVYGQVIADGKGAERDLDFSHAGVPTTISTMNRCGTNGWYAVNKGRLLMPRFPERWGAKSQYIGGYPYGNNSEDIDLVNSFRYYFDDETRNTSSTYIFAELYAADREDIPAGLPSGSRYYHSAIWRIGHFDLSTASSKNIRNKDLKKDYKAGFATVNLKFHYDPRLAEIANVDIVRVYRCADQSKGVWTCIGEALPSRESPYIQTKDFGPGSDLYNFGWIAVVGEEKFGTTIVVR